MERVREYNPQLTVQSMLVSSTIPFAFGPFSRCFSFLFLFLLLRLRRLLSLSEDDSDDDEDPSSMTSGLANACTVGLSIVLFATPKREKG